MKIFKYLLLFLLFIPFDAFALEISLTKPYFQDDLFFVGYEINGLQEPNKYFLGIKATNKETRDSFLIGDEYQVVQDHEFEFALPIQNGLDDYEFSAYLEERFWTQEEIDEINLEGWKYLSENYGGEYVDKYQEYLTLSKQETTDYSDIKVYTEGYEYVIDQSVQINASAFFDKDKYNGVNVYIQYWPKENPIQITGGLFSTAQYTPGSSTPIYKQIVDEEEICARHFIKPIDKNNREVDSKIFSDNYVCFGAPEQNPPSVITEYVEYDEKTAKLEASVHNILNDNQVVIYGFLYWEQGKKELTQTYTRERQRKGDGWIFDYISIKQGVVYCFQPYAKKAGVSFVQFGQELCFPGEWENAPKVEMIDLEIKNEKGFYKVNISSSVFTKSDEKYKVWIDLYQKGKEDKIFADDTGNTRQLVSTRETFKNTFSGLPVGLVYCFKPYARLESGGEIGVGREVCFPETPPTVISESYTLDENTGKLQMNASIWGGDASDNEYEFWFKVFEYNKGGKSTTHGIKKGNGTVYQIIYIKDILGEYTKGKTYCFMPFARNKNGVQSAQGEKVCFPKTPLVTTLEPLKVSYKKAYIRGKAHIKDLNTVKYYLQFQYWEKGTDKKNITKAQWFDARQTKDITYGVTINPDSNLKPLTTYCYRIVGGVYTDKQYENYGPIECFTTKRKPFSPPPPPPPPPPEQQLPSEYRCGGYHAKYISYIGSNMRSLRDMLSYIGQKSNLSPYVLFGLTVAETGFGGNFGGCCYPTESGAYFCTSCDPRSLQDTIYFRQITRSLGFNPYTTKVSCDPPIPGNGGAMGWTQFMPSEWANRISRISSQTGHYPPSPWNPCDAFTATSIYLKELYAKTGSMYNALKAYNGGWDYYARRILNVHVPCAQKYWSTPWNLKYCR